MPRFFWSLQAPVVMAMLLTLVNDRYLKWAHLLPPLVTGKLSDVCGLFFAPFTLLDVVLFAAPQWRRSRAHVDKVFLAVMVVTSLAFSLLKLCPFIAGVYNDALGALLERPVMLLPDVTDLLALTVLPLSVMFYRSRIGAALQDYVAVSSKTFLVLVIASTWTPLAEANDGPSATERSSDAEPEGSKVVVSQGRLNYGAGAFLGYVFGDLDPVDESRDLFPESVRRRHVGFSADARFFVFLEPGNTWFHQALVASAKYVQLESTESYSGGKAVLVQEVISFAADYRPSVRLSSLVWLYGEVGPQIRLPSARFRTRFGTQTINTIADLGVETSLGIQVGFSERVHGDLFFSPYPKMTAGLGVIYVL